MIDLRLGDYRETCADVEANTLISDPPYGDRTHTGHDAGVEHSSRGNSRWDTARRKALSYEAWGRDEVGAFVDFWAPRVSGWMAIMSCSDLAPYWRCAMGDAGRVTFAPVVCVIRAMSVRFAGDGPSSWAVYLNVSRPRNKEFATWGTLPGAYVGGRGFEREYTGGKPLWLKNAVVRDYSRRGDLIVDPCAGMATTGVAAIENGRRFVGSEVKPETHELALKRLGRPQQTELFA